jgi:hypothetical protein
MKTTCTRAVIIAMALALCGLAPPGAAAEQPPADPHAYGGNTQWTVIHASEFDEETQNTPLSGNVGNGYLFPMSPNTSWWKQVELPAGAQILQIVLIAHDINGIDEVVLDFCHFESGLNPNAPALACYGTVSTGPAGMPAFTNVTLNLSASPVLIKPWMDVPSGDGIQNWSAHHVLVWTTGGTVDPTLQFFGVAIQWQRTVSGAPVTATFSDVGTGHWAFRHIEALAASGITVGYGDGTYRPNNSVTRAEMAVFIAGALGLHWPL